MKTVKRKSVHTCTPPPPQKKKEKKKRKHLINLLFTKSLKRLEHCMQHHFPKMNCAADDRSANPVLIYSGTCFWFHNLQPLGQCWRSWQCGSFQMPFFRSCFLSIKQKISLISSARYAFSVPSDTETKSSWYRFVRTQFQLNYYCSLEQYANFIYRWSDTNYRAQGADLWGKVLLYRPQMIIAYAFISSSSRFHPHWLDLQWLLERSAGPWLKWHPVFQQIQCWLMQQPAEP